VKGMEGKGRRGLGREGKERGGEVMQVNLMRSWNRAADWLRPALKTEIVRQT